MAQQENTEEKRHISPLWPMAVSFLVLIYVVYVLLFMSKGWFSQKYDVTGQGTGLSVEDVASLEVYNTATDPVTLPQQEIDWIRTEEWDTGDYATMSDITRDDLTLHFVVSEGADAEFMPGVHGSFTAYVKTSCDQLYVTLTPVVDYATASNVSQTRKDNALRYARTHIAFFKSYNAASATDAYTQWAPTGERVVWEPAEAEGLPEGVKAITVYWIWVKEYTDISRERDETPLAPAVCTSMMGRLTASPTDWFVGLDNASIAGAGKDERVNAYDDADMQIALALRRIGFQMNISAY